MRRRVGMWMVLMVAAGCSGAPTGQDGEPIGTLVEARADQPFRLKVGEVADLGDGLLIAFRRVSEDSRCPMDVVCVWMGDAVVHLDVTVGRMAWSPVTLHTHLEPRAARFREYQIQLVELAPYPQSSKPIGPGEYVVTLDVGTAR